MSRSRNRTDVRFQPIGNFDAPSGGGGSFANPTATVGPTAVNGTATTAMRSDAAPALANSGVAAGTYGSATQVATFTADAKGRVTAASTSTTQLAKELFIDNPQTASYTLVLSDGIDTLVRMNVAGANNLTVPTNASVAFPIGTVIQAMQYGAGATTIVPAGGVVIRTASSLIARAQYSRFQLEKIGTDEWVAGGDLQ